MTAEARNTQQTPNKLKRGLFTLAWTMLFFSIILIWHNDKESKVQKEEMYIPTKNTAEYVTLPQEPKDYTSILNKPEQVLTDGKNICIYQGTIKVQEEVIPVLLPTCYEIFSKTGEVVLNNFSEECATPGALQIGNSKSLLSEYGVIEIKIPPISDERVYGIERISNAEQGERFVLKSFAQFEEFEVTQVYRSLKKKEFETKLNWDVNYIPDNAKRIVFVEENTKSVIVADRL